MKNAEMWFETFTFNSSLRCFYSLTNHLKYVFSQKACTGNRTIMIHKQFFIVSDVLEDEKVTSVSKHNETHTVPVPPFKGL